MPLAFPKTGYALIDRQHEVILDALERARRLPGVESYADFVMFLYDYVELHFLTEEALMAKTNYPRFSAHQQAHLAFTKHISEFDVEIKSSGLSQELAVTIIDAAEQWLHRHIEQHDRELADHLQRQG